MHLKKKYRAWRVYAWGTNVVIAAQLLVRNLRRTIKQRSYLLFVANTEIDLDFVAICAGAGSLTAEAFLLDG